MNNRRWLRFFIGCTLAALLLILTLLFIRTGFLRPQQIDDADAAHWMRDENGVIAGNDTITLQGNTRHCWLAIHSFAATPDEMRNLAEQIHQDRGDTVVAPRLLGHATLPSELQTYTMDDWYLQVGTEYRTLAATCDEVSVVGSSIGGALALRLAEDHDLHAVYAINPYLYRTPQHWYYLAPVEWYMEQLEPVLHFIRRREVAQISDPSGLAAHTAYYYLPVRPMTASREFFATTEARLSEITEPTLILHSTEDPVSDYQTATTIAESVTANQVALRTFSDSKHILLRDYEQLNVIQSILDFAAGTPAIPPTDQP